MNARVVDVMDKPFGSELVAAVSIGAGSIFVDDVSDFDDSGQLLLGTEVLLFSSINEDTGEIDLTATAAAVHALGDMVYVYPYTTERIAVVVETDDTNEDEGMEARVPHSLYDKLIVGDRTFQQGESVQVGFDGDEMVVLDVLGVVPSFYLPTQDPITGGPVTTTPLTDGIPPASSPTPTVAGGPRYLAIKWAAVANADAVTYEVHVGTSAAFATSAATRAAETPADIVYIRAVNGVALAYDTDYYVKLIAKDDDGAALVGVEVGPARLNPNGTDDFLAGSITAEKLSTVMALISSLIAGNVGADRLEVGFGTRPDGSLDTAFVGIRAYDTDGTTLTFMVDARTGQVFVRGSFHFGAGSLLESDIITLLAQPEDWQTPSLRQISSNTSTANSTSTVTTWPQTTLTGSLLLAVVITSDDDSAVGTHTTPAGGWALVKTGVETVGNESIRVSVFKLEDAASQSGSRQFDCSSAADIISARMYEFTGTGIEDTTVDAVALGNSTSPSVVHAANFVQNDSLAFGVIAHRSDNDFVPPDPFLEEDPAGDGWLYGSGIINHADGGHHGIVWYKPITDGLAETLADTISAPGAPWVAIICGFKAKAATVDPVGADFLKLYGKNDGFGPGNVWPHVLNQSGVEQAVVLGTADEIWRMEYVTSSVNIPSTTAHSAGATIIASITGLAVGDLCFLIGYTATSGLGAFIVQVDPVCSVAGQVTLTKFNADSGTQDPAITSFHFLVIHRS